MKFSFLSKIPTVKKGCGHPGILAGQLFWAFYIPIRVDSATKTLSTNLFTDQLYYSLTICKFSHFCGTRDMGVVITREGML